MPLNLWWVDLPIVDLATLPLFLEYLKGLAARGPGGKVYDQDLYLYWRASLLRDGVVKDISEAGRELRVARRPRAR